MSQFAHGISALDVADPETLAEPVWLLGRRYAAAENQVDAYQAAFESIIWLTYRRDFPAMTPYTHTSDAGWGCMLRSAQMLLAQALQRRTLGKEWRVPPPMSEATPLPDAYVKLLAAFVDAPTCLYSIHNLVTLGLQYDMLPGEWYGPTTAALVLRDLVNTTQHDEDNTSLAMYVPQEGVVYSDDVHKLVLSHLDDDAKTEAPSQADPAQGFFDPLLNPPTNDPERHWRRALLILLPLRLGLDSLNTSYLPALERTFTLPQSIGIIGGKKGHSVYFVGAQGDRLHLLDPHDVHPATEVNAAFPTATHLRTVHPLRPLAMKFESIDPSMALGFLCETRDDYLDFCQRVRAMQQEFGALCPFSVAERRPDYAIGEMDMMLNDCLLDGDGAMSSGGGGATASMSATASHGDSDDDGYVLI